VQETLNNTAKYAHASQVNMRLEEGEDFTRLTIQDDG